MTKALTFVEIDPPRCANTYSVAPCNARVIDANDPVAASFDGTDYLTRGAGLTGAADSKLMTISVWFRFTTSLATQRIFSSATTAAGGTLRSRMRVTSAGLLGVINHNAAGTTILQLDTTPLTAGRLYHALVSFDLSNVAKRHFYVSDVSNLDLVSAYSNDTIDFTLGDWSIGANPAGDEIFTGEIADLWVAPGVYIDFSVQANRRLFIDSSGKPVNLGATGSTPTGTAPLIFMSGDIATWHTNKATGGGFTLHGALTEGLFGTGTDKCFNCKATCQDPDNYIDVDTVSPSDPRTMRFSKQSIYYQESGVEAIPSITEVSVTPSVISLGKDLGQRASVEVRFKDHRDDDSFPNLDPYLADRTYDPYAQGTFWGKFKARHPYIIGAPFRLITGYLDQDLEDMETRHFIVESYEGPSDGKFSIRATDVQKLADAEKSVAPFLSEGYLLANITSSDTTFTVTPTGSGTSYPNTAYINLGGSEIVYAEHDPTAGNDANCLLLLHCDGVDATTTFTDSSTSARTVTANGNAQIDTAQHKFGTAAGLFDGAGDFLSLVDNAVWTQAANFTVDCWVRFNTLQDFRAIFAHGSDASNKYQLYVGATGIIKWEVNTAAVSIVFMQSAAGVIVDATWQHVALVRSGNVWTIYVDGVSVATTTDADAIPNYTGTFKIGIDQDGSSNPFKGWIDEFRFSNVARWTTDFDVLYATGRYATSTDAFFITRAQLNTTAAAHAAQDRAQLVLAYVSQDPADIAYDLYTNYVTGFDPAWITLSNWQTETATYNGNVYTTYITEPTPVKTLLEELVQQAAMSIYWNDITEQMQLQVLRAITTTAFDYTPDNYKAGTATIRDQLTTRLSQVIIYFGQINPLLPLTNKDNYRSSAIGRDQDSEDNWGQPAIQIILSRWIPQAGRTVADRLAEIILGRYKTPPRSLSFEVQRYAETDPELGGGYHLLNKFVQSATGSETDEFIPFTVTQLKPNEDSFSVVGEEMLFDAAATDLGNRSVAFDANRYNLNLRTEHDSIYPTPDGTETITFTIRSGVTIGSTSTGTYSVDLGTWPAGCTINLVLASGAIIVGKGGVGGAGGIFGAFNGSPGSSGGPALLLTRALTLTNNGTIEGGGGGGGGGGGSTVGGGGGGGGGGTDPGAGGPQGVGSAGSNDGAAGTTTAGGAGGVSTTGDGGAGGAPGFAGTAGETVGGAIGGAGGAIGTAVNGTSHVTYAVTGTIRGAQIN